MSYVFYRDQRKLNLFGRGGKNYMRRFAGERLNPKFTKKTVKFTGRRVRVMACFLARVL